ncbi:stage II sporulation protein M [Psychrobacillus sp. PGGUH221]|uniref:stage II sporulation protein M n=1 Tax=Psychrobacillus sp. PGGUH221 TaxID=3020058 RepID=UPI0035C7193F
MSPLELKDRKSILLYIRNIYRNEIVKFSAFKFHFYICSFLFVLMAFVGYYIAISFPEFIQAYLDNKRSGLNGKGISIKSESFPLMLSLFKNNLTSCYIYILVGFIPFIFAPYLYVCMNGLIIGEQLIKGISLSKIILVGLLPHGITELPALFLSASIGIYFCMHLIRKIIKRNANIQMKQVIKNGLTTFVFVVIPLLIVSAFIEAFITKFLILDFL